MSLDHGKKNNNAIYTYSTGALRYMQFVPVLFLFFFPHHVCFVRRISMTYYYNGTKKISIYIARGTEVVNASCLEE
jgi:hypothetical protein